MLLSIFKARGVFFLIALIVAVCSVAWGYAQVESVSSSDPMAMQKLAYSKMLTDGIQNLMAVVMMWLVVSAAAKVHVPLKTLSVLNIAIKSCFVFITGMVIFMFTAAVIANALGFDASQVTERRLYDIQNENMYLITFFVAIFFAFMTMWSAAFISLITVRAQVKQVSKYAKSVDKPGFIRTFFGIDSALSPTKAPHIWGILAVTVCVKFLSWHLAMTPQPFFMFVGHVMQASVYVFFVVLLEQCLIAVSNNRFSPLHKNLTQID